MRNEAKGKIGKDIKILHLSFCSLLIILLYIDIRTLTRHFGPSSYKNTPFGFMNFDKIIILQHYKTFMVWDNRKSMKKSIKG
jgi:hypothetical protein